MRVDLATHMFVCLLMRSVLPMAEAATHNRLLECVDMHICGILSEVYTDTLNVQRVSAAPLVLLGQAAPLCCMSAPCRSCVAWQVMPSCG